MNENCGVDVPVDRNGYQSKKKVGNNCSSSFSRSFHYDSLAFGFYGTLLLQLMLLTTTVKKTTLFAGIHVYSRGIAGFTGSRVQSRKVET